MYFGQSPRPNFLVKGWGNFKPLAPYCSMTLGKAALFIRLPSEDEGSYFANREGVTDRDTDVSTKTPGCSGYKGPQAISAHENFVENGLRTISTIPGPLSHSRLEKESVKGEELGERFSLERAVAPL